MFAIPAKIKNHIIIHMRVIYFDAAAIFACDYTIRVPVRTRTGKNANTYFKKVFMT